MTDQKRSKPEGVAKPFYFDIAELYMDMNSGAWLNLPFGNKIDDITDYEMAVLTAAKIGRTVWRIWNKEAKHRTPKEYEFMSWANRCLNA